MSVCCEWFLAPIKDSCSHPVGMQCAAIAFIKFTGTRHLPWRHPTPHQRQCALGAPNGLLLGVATVASSQAHNSSRQSPLQTTSACHKDHQWLQAAAWFSGMAVFASAHGTTLDRTSSRMPSRDQGTQAEVLHTLRNRCWSSVLASSRTLAG